MGNRQVGARNTEEISIFNDVSRTDTGSQFGVYSEIMEGTFNKHSGESGGGTTPVEFFTDKKESGYTVTFGNGNTGCNTIRLKTG